VYLERPFFNHSGLDASGPPRSATAAAAVAGSSIAMHARQTAAAAATDAEIRQLFRAAKPAAAEPKK
jgi:hypothetical protein